MEESKSFAAKQTQGGDDSGYSSTSTQSKYSVKSCHSQSASSGDSCFEERRSSTLKTTDDGKMSTLNSKSTEQPNQTILRNVSSLETKTNQESNKNSKSEQQNLPAFTPQMDQLYSIDVSELEKSPPASKMDYNESKNINTEENLDWKNTDFLQLNSLCKSYCDFKNVKNSSMNTSDKFTISETVLKELNDQEVQIKDIIESDEVHDDSFGVVVSMNNGLIINTSNSIHKNMGYPKYMWQGRSFIDYIHPKDRISFTSYVTSVLTDPYTISSQDDISSVTFLRSKKNDGFYCNMRRYKGLLNTGYTVPQSKNLYQVCKLTITFRDLSYASASSYLAKIIKMPQSQLLLIVNAQLIHSVYKYPEEKLENPVCFMTKHNALFEWCYVDHLIISHFGYLPQNIIGRSIFDYYNINDLTTIKQFHENMTKASCVSYVGKPYQFKCQNGNFALVQTEWSNFVNPWSGRVEFVTGKHKVIQGPLNPDITTPASDDTSDVKMSEEIKTPNEVFEDINKILNKNIFGADVSHEINQTLELSAGVNQQISKKYKDLALCLNCLEPLEIKVQPELCGSFSDHDSVMLGEISPHHNYESKSGSETPPSYTQLNYNDNIQRFFNSKPKINSPEELSEHDYVKENTAREVTPPDLDTDNIQKETLIPSSSMIINKNPTSYYSETKLKNNSQQPLTQKMLIRHNKKMEDDLVKQHKNKAKKNKSGEKPNLSEENINIPDIAHGIKRCNSSNNENKSCKMTKKKYLINSGTSNVSQTQEVENIVVTPTVARATQIWSPCQITRDSQTTADLPYQKYCNNQLINNVMPTRKHNKYKNMSILMDLQQQKQETQTSQLQPSLPMPFYATAIPDHIPQNSKILQPYIHHNQLLLQPYKNIEWESKMDSQNEPLAMISNLFHQVNQEEVITSSDSDCRKEIGSLQSSGKWKNEDSSFYSSTLREKTDSSEVEDESSWSTKLKKTKFSEQFVKKQPFWMEDVVTTPDLVFRYQIEHKDINEVLKKDMDLLTTYTQPQLVNEQFRQLYEEIDVNGASKTCCNDGTSTSSGEDECLIYIGINKKKKVDFSKLAMFYEENASIPSPTTAPH